MNDVTLQIISGVVQILASIVSIVSVLLTSWKEIDRAEINTFKSTSLSLGHEEVYPFYKWLVYISFGVYCAATCVLLYFDEVSNFFLYSTIGTFIVMLSVVFFLAAKGKRSLESRSIIAPKKLWQVLFNQIPSYLEEVDGPLNISLVNIGVDTPNTPSMGEKLRMDDDNDLGRKAIWEEIEKCKENLKRCVEISSSNVQTPLYTINESNDLFSHKSDKHTIHGIIAFIGNGLTVDEVNSRLHFLAKKFKYTPIGFVSYGAYPSSKLPPYVNLTGLSSQDTIHHLIFRYYTRSRARQRLSRSYRKFFLWVAAPLSLFLLAIPAHLLYRNYRAECSKMVITAPEEQEDESNFTRLVNTLLVSPRPLDVKIWERNDSLKETERRYINTHRYSKQGVTSTSKGENSMIAAVMRTQVFLAYDKKASCRYTVWDRVGKECEGHYYCNDDSYVALVKDSVCVFKWIPKRKGASVMDDNNIRMMYSYNGKKAVEIIYSEDSGDTVRDAIRHSDTYLLGIQQFLIAATLDGLELGKQKKDSIKVAE